jgi:hypothetical protein
MAHANGTNDWVCHRMIATEANWAQLLVEQFANEQFAYFLFDFSEGIFGNKFQIARIVERAFSTKVNAGFGSKVPGIRMQSCANDRRS